MSLPSLRGPSALAIGHAEPSFPSSPSRPGTPAVLPTSSPKGLVSRTPSRGGSLGSLSAAGASLLGPATPSHGRRRSSSLASPGTGTSAVGSSSGGSQGMKKSDVDWVLGGLDHSDYDRYFNKTAFIEDCRRRFSDIDANGSGFLEHGELAESVARVFPTLQMELNTADHSISAPTENIAAVLATFDEDGDGRLSVEEFPELVKFAEGWRRRQYKTVEQELGLHSPPLKVGQTRRSLGGSGRLELMGRGAPSWSGGRGLSETAPANFAGGEAASPPRPRSSSRLLRPARVPSKGASLPSSDLGGRLSSNHCLRPNWKDTPGPRSGHSSKTNSRAGSISRPGSSCPSRPSSSASARRSSKGSPQKSSRNASPAIGGHADWRQRQMEAFGVLVDEMGAGTGLRELLQALLRDVVTRECEVAFSGEDIDNAMSEAMQHTKGAAPPTLAWAVPAADSKAPAHDSALDGGHAQGAESDQPEDVTPSLTILQDNVLRILRALVENSSLSLSDVVGQTLLRHRRAEALQPRRLKAAAEDTSWCGEFVDRAADVFKMVTSAHEGRMRKAEWARIMKQVIQNPVLGARIRSTDVDRVFASMMMRKKDSERSITISEFMELLIQLAESVGAHPWVMFTAVGCRADRMEATSEFSGV